MAASTTTSEGFRYKPCRSTVYPPSNFIKSKQNLSSFFS